MGPRPGLQESARQGGGKGELGATTYLGMHRIPVYGRIFRPFLCPVYGPDSGCGIMDFLPDILLSKRGGYPETLRLGLF